MHFLVCQGLGRDIQGEVNGENVSCRHFDVRAGEEICRYCGRYFFLGRSMLGSEFCSSKCKMAFMREQNSFCGQFASCEYCVHYCVCSEAGEIRQGNENGCSLFIPVSRLRKCLFCGSFFKPKDMRSRYCSKKCMNAGSYAKKSKKVR